MEPDLTGAMAQHLQGSRVAVHYTAKGSEETAEEIDQIGKGGLNTTEATTSIAAPRTLSLKTADGAERDPVA